MNSSCHLAETICGRGMSKQKLFGAVVFIAVVLVTLSGWDERLFGKTRRPLLRPTDDSNSAESNLLPPLCGKLQARFPPGSIPPLVHWTSRDGRIPAKLVNSVLTWRRLLNSSGRDAIKWRFMHWDDRQIAELVSKHYPMLNRSYAKLVNGLERSDIGRLVVLHHVGGMYVDTDVELLRDLSPLMNSSRLLLGKDTSRTSCCSAVLVEEPVEHALFVHNMPRLVSNAVMLSRANHSFLTYLLNAWPAWFEANWARKTNRRHTEAPEVTGPLMLSRFFDEYRAWPPDQRPSDWSSLQLVDAELFQPRFDETSQHHRLKKFCSVAPEKLNQLKRLHCERLALAKFRNQPIPKRAFTVHAFMHLSYTKTMDLANSKTITDLLPISHCQL